MPAASRFAGAALHLCRLREHSIAIGTAAFPVGTTSTTRMGHRSHSPASPTVRVRDYNGAVSEQRPRSTRAPGRRDLRAPAREFDPTRDLHDAPVLRRLRREHRSAVRRAGVADEGLHDVLGPVANLRISRHSTSGHRAWRAARRRDSSTVREGGARAVHRAALTRGRYGRGSPRLGLRASCSARAGRYDAQEPGPARMTLPIRSGRPNRSRRRSSASSTARPASARRTSR
jgi:hypothetical protein